MRYFYGNLKFIVISLVFFTVYLTRFLDEQTSSSFVTEEVGDEQRKLSVDQQDTVALQIYSKPGEEFETKQRKDIFFLKTHKCGSSTVQNILMRYGFKEGLDFVLPEEANYLGHPAYFTPSMIGESVRTPDGNYNIFTHHTRFNNSSVKKIMNLNAVYVTILRKPAEHYESLYNYYHFEKRFKMNLTTFLEHESSVKRARRGGLRLGYNQMCFDLGLNEKKFESSGKIKQWILEIDRKFDLVLMTEYMEESLILLANAMRWPLKNLVFLKINVRKSTEKRPLSEAQKKIIRKLNKCDFRLQDYFFKKFQQRIRTFGIKRMNHELRKFIRLNDEFSRKCGVIVATNNSLRSDIVEYQALNERDSECLNAVTPEIPFTNLLRNIQRERVAKLRSQESLMRNSNFKVPCEKNIRYSGKHTCNNEFDSQDDLS